MYLFKLLSHFPFFLGFCFRESLFAFGLKQEKNKRRKKGWQDEKSPHLIYKHPKKSRTKRAHTYHQWSSSWIFWFESCLKIMTLPTWDVLPQKSGFLRAKNMEREEKITSHFLCKLSTEVSCQNRQRKLTLCWRAFSPLPPFWNCSCAVCDWLFLVTSGLYQIQCPEGEICAICFSSFALETRRVEFKRQLRNYLIRVANFKEWTRFCPII